MLFLLLKGVFFCYPKLRCKDIESLVLKKEMLKESISFCIFLLEWGLFLCFECCVVAIRQQHYWQAVSSRRGRFIVPAYLYSTCICNPFETHLCNVRNVFVICVLHIRRVKVWFLRCKSMVFGVQKGGFYIAKVWFLQCKNGGVIFWLRHSYNVAMY